MTECRLLCHCGLSHLCSLYDRLGPDFTLLRLGKPADDTSAIEDAAAKRRVPLRVLTIAEPAALEAYEEFPLVLVRPDQHIAWRGHSVPADPLALIDRVRGA